MKHSRLFVAIVPDSIFIQSLKEKISLLKKEKWPGTVRWMPDSNLHLTLRFLGETDNSLIPEIKKALNSCAVETERFKMTASNLLFLPRKTKANVIALGFQPEPAIASLATSVEKAMVVCGFKAEKRQFMAHLTIGRCKLLNMTDIKPSVDLSGISFSADSLKLVKSTLTDKGAVYEILETFSFGTED